MKSYSVHTTVKLKANNQGIYNKNLCIFQNQKWGKKSTVKNIAILDLSSNRWLPILVGRAETAVITIQGGYANPHRSEVERYKATAGCL